MNHNAATATAIPRPQDDLFGHINGQWIAEHTIPADRAIDGAFHALRDEAEEAVRELITQADPESRVGRLYRSFIDSEAIGAAGVSALTPDLEVLATGSDRSSLALALAKLDRTGIPGPVAYWIEKDSTSDAAMAYLVQSGLGLPDEAYYREANHADTLAAYQAHVATMLELFTNSVAQSTDSHLKSLFDSYQLSDSTAAAAQIVAVEKQIAAGHWDVVSARDSLKTYNKMELSQLPEGFPFAQWLAATGVNEVNATAVSEIVVMMPSYLEHFAALWQDTELEQLRLWALWLVLRARSPYLPEEFSEQNFEFYGRTLQGATQQRDRWKRAVGFVEGAVGHDVGRLYVAQHFPATHKEQMLELVDYLLAAYRERISELPWMTEATQQRALEKLSQFKTKIGYPERWRDYSALTVGDNLLDNVRAAAAFSHDYQVAKLGSPADREEWHADPQTVNAFYNPVVNDITFPAAILKPPFFSPQASPAENFGAIGAVIGHEIGHGFDDQGSQYDGHGNLQQWWTDADRAAFEQLTDALVEQYEGLVPTVLREAAATAATAADDEAADPAEAAELPGVNGRFTLGENIGDLGGLGIAVVAYRRFLRERGAELGIADTPESYRGIFEQWALVWRTKIRAELARQYLAIDPHSPAEFRCNVIVSNIDEFHEAYGTAPGDGMWRDPADRVTIW